MIALPAERCPECGAPLTLAEPGAGSTFTGCEHAAALGQLVQLDAAAPADLARLRAVRQLVALGLAPSEALDVVRGAGRLDGDLAETVPLACEVLATASEERARAHRQAAWQMRAHAELADTDTTSEAAPTGGSATTAEQGRHDAG